MEEPELALPADSGTEQSELYEEEYEASEFGDIDELGDPETLWNTYLKGVRFHGDDHNTKNKSRMAKKASLHKEKGSPTKSELVEIVPSESLPKDKDSENIVRPKELEAHGSEEDDEEVSAPTESMENNYAIQKKKLRMRTIADVISRIQWDPDLPAENFSVGYLDRFLGLMEKPFQFFCWEDLASVDYNVLAVPKHRIVYVKYRGQKVWDKNARLDLVFGSTESSKAADIRELVQEIDAEYEQRAVNYSNYDYGSDSDDSDDVQIKTENRTAIGNVRRFPECRPNYFVAVRITDPKVIAKVAEAKQYMVSKDARISNLLMPEGSLHITMAMLKLDDSAEIATAAHALEDCRKQKEHFLTHPITVELQGLATFNGNVLYAPVQAPTAFYEFHKWLLEKLKGAGVRLAHEFDFVPHMTFLKLTRSRARVFQSPYIDPFVYVDYKDTHFGFQVIDNLQLCVIGEEKRFDGFYNCAAEVYFT